MSEGPILSAYFIKVILGKESLTLLSEYFKIAPDLLLKDEDPILIIENIDKNSKKEITVPNSLVSIISFFNTLLLGIFILLSSFYNLFILYLFLKKLNKFFILSKLNLYLTEN